MVIEVYGKRDCGLCKSAKRKLEHLLKKWQLDSNVGVKFLDVETEYGAAEGDFYDVFEIPSILLKTLEKEVIARWDGQAPPSEELRAALAA